MWRNRLHASRGSNLGINYHACCTGRKAGCHCCISRVVLRKYTPAQVSAWALSQGSAAPGLWRKKLRSPDLRLRIEAKTDVLWRSRGRAVFRMVIRNKRGGVLDWSCNCMPYWQARQWWSWCWYLRPRRFSSFSMCRRGRERATIRTTVGSTSEGWFGSMPRRRRNSPDYWSGMWWIY